MSLERVRPQLPQPIRMETGLFGDLSPRKSVSAEQMSYLVGMTGRPESVVVRRINGMSFADVEKLKRSIRGFMDTGDNDDKGVINSLMTP